MRVLTRIEPESSPVRRSNFHLVSAAELGLPAERISHRRRWAERWWRKYWLQVLWWRRYCRGGSIFVEVKLAWNWLLAASLSRQWAWLGTTPTCACWRPAAGVRVQLAGGAQTHCSLESSWILLAVFSFSSRISLNFFMLSKNSALRLRVMNSFAFLLSLLLLVVCTVIVSVRISLKEAY